MADDLAAGQNRAVWGWAGRGPWVLLWACLGWAGLTDPALAQRDTTPTQAYYSLLSPYHAGEYRFALKGYLAEGRGSIKGINGRWIDAICYHTMAGECYYQLGQYPQALDQYTSALQLFLKFNDWMIRVQFPAVIKPAGPGQLRPVPWGASARTVRHSDIPEQMMISQGQINNNAVVRQGGIASPPVLFPLHVTEIARQTTLALRRRRELMGPAGAHDPLHAELVAALAKRPIAPNHWSEAWIDVELGLAYAALGNDGQALGYLQRGLVAGGEYDHPLSPIVLFELGRIALSQNDLNSAGRYFEEATYSAIQYGDGSTLEDAFKYAHLTYLLTSPKQPYPLLEVAANWARVKNYGALRAALTAMAAEDLLFLNRTNDAANMLVQAKAALGTRDMAQARLGAWVNYLAAQSLYQQGKVAQGDEALAPVMVYQRSGASLWMFHVSLVDALYVQGKLSDRVAMALFSTVLREPQPADWSTDPLESLSVLMIPHHLPYEHWFDVALARKEFDVALEISDLVRRHRFLSTLAMGGRLLGLQWLLEGPADLLDQTATLQKADLLARHPAYAQLSQQLERTKAELARLPLVAEGREAQQQQQALLGQLAATSALQEALLREVALRREAAQLVFPPQRKVKDVQKSLTPGQAVLVFFSTSQRLYASLMSNEKYVVWEVGAPQVLVKQTATLLREWGHFESSRPVPLDELRDIAWHKTARGLADLLMKGSKSELPGGIEELVIVPDSVLWYLPLEALPIGSGDRYQPLIATTRVRYAPTIGLSLPDARARKQSMNTALVLGKIDAALDPTVVAEAVAQFNQAVKGGVSLQAPLPAPSSIYSVLFDRLVVWDDVAAGESGPYGWAPVTLDRTVLGSSLDHWIRLPWGGPDQVILPAFHTAAEDSLKRAPLAEAGNDIFLPVCGLMASGCRTILLGRWRTGGQSTFDLTREFVQELPHTTAAEAWQRSVLLCQQMPLNLEWEPRIQARANENPPSGAHPFFWAGNLLIDSGTPPFKSEVPAEAEKAAAAN